MSEVESAKCECCGLTEKCTAAYIERIKERYDGKWICGLCGEAVKDEMMRCSKCSTVTEALNRHMSFCNNFRSSSPPSNPTVHLISAMRQIMRRSFGSPRMLRSMPPTPTKNSGLLLIRSESCIPSLSLNPLNLEETNV